jgi:hypothetical protein
LSFEEYIKIELFSFFPYLEDINFTKVRVTPQMGKPFEGDIDFMKVGINATHGVNRLGRPRIDYHVSLDMAIDERWHLPWHHLTRLF